MKLKVSKKFRFIRVPDIYKLELTKEQFEAIILLIGHTSQSFRYDADLSVEQEDFISKLYDDYYENYG